MVITMLLIIGIVKGAAEIEFYCFVKLILLMLMLMLMLEVLMLILLMLMLILVEVVMLMIIGRVKRVGGGKLTRPSFHSH